MSVLNRRRTGGLSSESKPRRSRSAPEATADPRAVAEAEAFIEATEGVDAQSQDGLSELLERARARREAAGEAEVEAQNDPLAGLGPIQRFKAARKLRESSRLKGAFTDYPHLMALKPREYYIFHSDYFRIDGQYASILAFFHDDAAHDDFVPFWGVNRVPSGMPDGTTTVVLDSVSRVQEDEVKSFMRGAERLSNVEQREARGSGKSAQRRVSKTSADLDQIVAEIQSNASYLKVHSRMMVKAGSLADLDTCLERISSQFISAFGTLRVAPYIGVQRQELTTLFSPLRYRRGEPFGFTSVEYAGAYHLVTNGLNDPHGEYVGDMVGDVNNSAIIMDVNNYAQKVVIADNGSYEMPADETGFVGRLKRSAAWASKLSQAALLHNHRVVHLVMDDTDLNLLGPSLDKLTARLDMNSGDINMLEMFGDPSEEITVFNAQLEKLVLMTEQAYLYSDGDTGADRDVTLQIIRGELKQTLTQFYIDRKMWVPNASRNRESLRLVNLPHDQVPLLKDLVSYFDTRYKAQVNADHRDDDSLRAYSVLRLVYRNLLENHTDLFNEPTNAAIDEVNDARRIIYDFSRLRQRGAGIAMAQLVNTVGFAVQSLSYGDVVIVHGVGRISDSVKRFLQTQFSIFTDRGGRMVYVYNEIPEMVSDIAFNRFDSADYTVLGPMTDAVRDQYKETMKQSFPSELDRLLTSRDEGYNYLRRGHTNVVFTANLTLGMDPSTVSARMRLRSSEDKRKNRTQDVISGIPNHMANAPQTHVRRREASPATSSAPSSEAGETVAPPAARVFRLRTQATGTGGSTTAVKGAR